MACALVRAASRLVGMPGEHPRFRRFSAGHRHKWRGGSHECAIPLSFPGIGDSAGFVGRVFNLRPISIRLPASVQKAPRRVTNPPQVENPPHKAAEPPVGQAIAFRDRSCCYAGGGETDDKERSSVSPNRRFEAVVVYKLARPRGTGGRGAAGYFSDEKLMLMCVSFSTGVPFSSVGL